jgi:hypothetical protein
MRTANRVKRVAAEQHLQYESSQRVDDRRAYYCRLKFQETMGNGMRHMILFLVVMSVFISLAYAEGCGGACVVSSGGSSYNFMSDPATNIDMSSFDEFVRDNLGNNKTTLHTESLSQETLSNNQTCNGNVSQNASEVGDVMYNPGYTTLDNRTFKLGAEQDKGLSTPVYATSNSFMF